MSPDELTAEQRQTIHDLQTELKGLDLQADIEWAKYMHTGDLECYNEAMALDGEREMKGLIAYIPKAGEHKVSKIRDLLSKVKLMGGVMGETVHLGNWEARIETLRQINEWRDGYGLPPLERMPRGVPGDAGECTIAMAFRMSLQEMGYKNIGVKVQDHEDIHLSGIKEGMHWWDTSPKLDESANTVISEFDESAWLDLLKDSSLRGYADQVADNHDCDNDDMVGRLQEISDEMIARGFRHITTVKWWIADGGLEGNGGWKAPGVILGVDTALVADQIDSNLAQSPVTI